MLDLKKMREERTAYQNDLDGLKDVIVRESRSFSDGETNKFDDLFAKVTDLDKRIATAERLERIPSRGTSAVETRRDILTRDTYARGFANWVLKTSNQKVGEEGYQCMERAGLTGDSVSWAMPENYPNRWERDQSTTNNQGGYLVDGIQVQGLVERQKLYGGFRNFCDVVVTPNSAPIGFATTDDTSHLGEVHAELGDANQTALVFGQKTLGGFDVDSGVWPISYTLLRNAQVNFLDRAQNALLKRIGRKQSDLALNGGGTTEPTGVLTEVSTGTTSSSITDISFSDVENLFYSVDKLYRDDPSAAFVCNDKTLGKIALGIRDENLRPLMWNYAGSLSDAPGTTLFGKPVIVDNAMPDPAAGTIPLIFGAGNSVVWREITDGIQVQVLREIYAQKLAIGLIAYTVFDVRLVDVFGVMGLKMHAAT